MQLTFSQNFQPVSQHKLAFGTVKLWVTIYCYTACLFTECWASFSFLTSMTKSTLKCDPRTNMKFIDYLIIEPRLRISVEGMVESEGTRGQPGVKVSGQLVAIPKRKGMHRDGRLALQVICLFFDRIEIGLRSDDPDEAEIPGIVFRLGKGKSCDRHREVGRTRAFVD